MYTNLKVKTIGNPGEFVNQIVHAVTGWEEALTSNSQVPPPTNIPPPLPSMLRRSPHRMLSPFSSSDAQRRLISRLLQTENNEILNKSFQEQSANDKFPQPPTNSNDLQSLMPTNHKVVQRTASNAQPRRSRPRGGNSSISNIGFHLIRELHRCNPILGYSFYFLWVGCILHLLALIVGVANWRMSIVKSRGF